MIRPDGTASDAILTTITPAQRVPSIGTQLTIEAPCTCDHDRDAHDWRGCRWYPCRCTGTLSGSVHPTQRPQPERLTLWDQPADLWSTDR